MAAIWNHPVQTVVIQGCITMEAIKIAAIRVGGMTLTIEHLLCKQEELSLIP